MDLTALIYAVVCLGVLGLLFGFALGAVAKKFGIDVDPKVAEILDNLPGANCGACGYPGCSGYAEAVATGKAPVTGCTPGGDPVAAIISKIMGVTAEGTRKMMAVVRCQGDHEHAVDAYTYYGVPRCAVAQNLDSGHKACTYGCLGFGDCVEACPFDALFMSAAGLPVVIEEKCTACGACVRACPRDIIALIPADEPVYLGCVNRGRGKAVKDACRVGCIGCSICAKEKGNPQGGIEMDDALPVLNFDHPGHDFADALRACPQSSFVRRLPAAEAEVPKAS